MRPARAGQGLRAHRTQDLRANTTAAPCMAAARKLRGHAGTHSCCSSAVHGAPPAAHRVHASLSAEHVRRKQGLLHPLPTALWRRTCDLHDVAVLLPQRLQPHAGGQRKIEQLCQQLALPVSAFTGGATRAGGGAGRSAGQLSRTPPGAARVCESAWERAALQQCPTPGGARHPHLAHSSAWRGPSSRLTASWQQSVRY